ncbi:hypothetical protein O6H91_Y177100 [Diphasiastrum complanatum]|nr:hypothetical protein O6H91_Y177100 [Diphasiastrum complanatum]KAJ7295599.1 hypothetical protein O6H91_Y177100 [Diphasiastrum complanatum]KAJ7295601.1 hypothetical protein O6H91_Y177100 [Diphasiastrum complanatum]
MFESNLSGGNVESPSYHDNSKLQSEVAENVITNVAMRVPTKTNPRFENQLLRFDDSELLFFGPPSVTPSSDIIPSLDTVRPQQTRYESLTSESGWTTYLEQSTSENFLKIQDTGCARRDVRRYSTDTMYDHSLSEQSGHEDSSMASDASSGPEHPPSNQDSQGAQQNCASVKPIQASIEEVRFNCRRDACNSNSCESVSDGSPAVNSRKMKRRKRDVYEELHSVGNVNGVWPELISNLQIERERAADESSSEGHAQSHVFDHVLDSDDKWARINSSLEMLQQLIPNVQELDEEGMLEVAVIYVKSLEQKIRVVALQSPDFLTSAAKGGPSNDHQETALYDKGLCLMPLSFLTKDTI